jgi:hypothetical protein
MTNEKFKVLLLAASYEALRFGSEFVTNHLSWRFEFHVFPNFNNDTGEDDGFKRYPDEPGKCVYCSTFEQVTDLLVREDRCPVWINIFLSRANSKTTLLKLECAGRYTDDEQRFYNRASGFGPFIYKSPVFPPRWKEGRKFKLEKF